MENTTDKSWWKKAIIYEFYVDKFAGNFNGLREKLYYLTYLGVDTLWLLPHYPSPMIDGGYDVADYTSVRPDLGSMDDFDVFIEEAHAKGFRIILDLVLNHTSDQHQWFLESRSSENNPKRDWYIWAKNDHKFSEAFVHFSNIKKNNWISSKTTDDYYYASFYPEQPDLNWDNPEVFDAMTSVMDFWLARGINGFRLDAISRLIKRDGTNCFGLPETHQIVKRIRQFVDENYPGTVLIAESGGWPNEARQFFGDGDECHVVLNFPIAANLLSAVQDKDLSSVNKVVEESSGIGDNCRWGFFLTNHDSVDLFFITDEFKKNRLGAERNMLKRFGRESEYSFGARLAEICDGDKEKILWSHKQLFKLSGVPILYYGNEIGMRNAIIQKPRDYRDYVRADFDWNQVDVQKGNPNSVLNGIKNLIWEYKNKQT